MKPTSPECKHDFEYSHQEKKYLAPLVLRAVDVVICRKCGLIKRTIVEV